MTHEDIEKMLTVETFKDILDSVHFRRIQLFSSFSKGSNIVRPLGKNKHIISLPYVPQLVNSGFEPGVTGWNAKKCTGL